MLIFPIALNCTQFERGCFLKTENTFYLRAFNWPYQFYNYLYGTTKCSIPCHLDIHKMISIYQDLLQFGVDTWCFYHLAYLIYTLETVPKANTKNGIMCDLIRSATTIVTLLAHFWYYYQCCFLGLWLQFELLNVGNVLHQQQLIQMNWRPLKMDKPFD